MISFSSVTSCQKICKAHSNKTHIYILASPYFLFTVFLWEVHQVCIHFHMYAYIFRMHVPNVSHACTHIHTNTANLAAVPHRLHHWSHIHAFKLCMHKRVNADCIPVLSCMCACIQGNCRTYAGLIHILNTQKLLKSDASLEAMKCKACELCPKGVIIDATSMKIDRSKIEGCLWWVITQTSLQEYTLSPAYVFDHSYACTLKYTHTYMHAYIHK